jgi:uncharacterized integral membrane protein
MKLRDLLAVVITAFVVIFVVQNLHSVEVQILPWRLSVSAAILTLAPFLIGLLIGRTATLFPTRRRSRRAIGEGEEQTPALPSGEDGSPPSDAEVREQ